MKIIDRGDTNKYEAAMRSVRNATSVLPSFVKDRKKFIRGIGARKVCCFLCAAKDAKLPLRLVQFIYDYKVSMKEVLDLKDDFLQALGDHWNGYPLDYASKMRCAQAKKLVAICHNMLDKFGNNDNGIGLVHPHYLGKDQMYFKRFNMEESSKRDRYIGLGQIMLFFECRYNNINSVKFLKRLTEHFATPPDNPQLYSDMEGLPCQKAQVICTRPRIRMPEIKTPTFVPQNGSIFVKYGLYPSEQIRRSYDMDDDGMEITDKVFFKIEGVLQQLKREISETRVVVVDKLPFIVTEQFIVLNSINLWLQMIKNVHGSLENLLVVFVIDVDDFEDSLGTKNVAVINEFVGNTVEKGEKVEIIAVDATSSNKKLWKRLPSKWTS